LDAEAVRARCSFYNLQVPAVTLPLAPVGQLLTAIGGIRPNFLEPWNEERESAKEFARTDGVVDIGGGDVAGDGQAHDIDKQMPLPALHALMGVKATDASRLLDGLHTLAVDDGCTGVGVATDALALSTVQRAIQQVPSTLEAKAPEMLEHRLPGREVGGEVPPGAAGAQHVEDSIEDAA
jgi:hypothetical protein